MAAVSVAAEWQLLHNRYYRKPELYPMRWGSRGGVGGAGVDLRRYRVACAPFGGPIAAIRDDSKIVQLHAESARRRLRIFSSAGSSLASAPWDRPGGRLVGMAWSDAHILACVVQDGTIYRFDVRAEVVGTQISLGPECFEEGVAECVFWGGGVACRTEDNKLFCVPDLGEPRPCRLADPGLLEAPRCMAVIEPQYTMSGNVEVLLGAAEEDGVLVVDEEGVQRLGAGVGRITKMAVSGNGKMLAAFTEDGRLLVLPTDFSRIMFEYDSETVVPPEQMAWCGMDSVLLYWEELLLMVGPHGDPVRYQYDEPIALIPECDGVRILSNSSMEFLQRVPDSTVSIFQIGSTEPAALLYDALEHFDKRSAKADENLRLIHSALPDAVEACIDAAGHEFDVSRQRTLLRAASYGQSFCSFGSQLRRDHFQEMCKTLRVLNAVRDPDIGIPLSIHQYKLLTAPILIARLINAHQHLLAMRISEYLDLNPEVVIMHWACTTITASSSIHDAALLEVLLDKLKLCKGISYAAVAAHADNCGKRKLAAMLVDHEPRSSKQVPLLLSIGEDEASFVKAAESGDTDLIYLVLFHVWQKKSPLEFFGMIHPKPLARDLFIAYARCYKHEFLKDFFLSIGQLQDVAYLLLKESWELGSNQAAGKGSGSPLQGPRIRVIEQAQKLFSETKEHSFELKAAEEHAKLLKIQHELEVSTKQAIFVDSSISDTIRTCIVLGNHRAAMKVKSDFKVSEKRWYWLKSFALSTIRDWDALEKFSREKRPPTGYKPFVEACIDAGEKNEALKYIPKLTDPREKAEAFERIGMAKEAADAAAEAKDSELLGRFKLSFPQNVTATLDAIRDRFPFQGVSY